MIYSVPCNNNVKLPVRHSTLSTDKAKRRPPDSPFGERYIRYVTIVNCVYCLRGFLLVLTRTL